MTLTATRPLLTLAALGAAALTAGCVTHRSTPTLSKAVLDARAHRDVPATLTCPDLASPTSIAFGFEDADPGELNTQPLLKLAQGLNCHPQATALIVAQADGHGTEAEQQALAEKRAAAVRDSLAGHGVAAGRITVQIAGKAPPGDPTHVTILAEGRRW